MLILPIEGENESPYVTFPEGNNTEKVYFVVGTTFSPCLYHAFSFQLVLSLFIHRAPGTTLFPPMDKMTTVNN
jgi:hypothetical protein